MYRENDKLWIIKHLVLSNVPAPSPNNLQSISLLIFNLLVDTPWLASQKIELLFSLFGSYFFIFLVFRLFFFFFSISSALYSLFVPVSHFIHGQTKNRDWNRKKRVSSWEGGGKRKLTTNVQWENCEEISEIQTFWKLWNRKENWGKSSFLNAEWNSKLKLQKLGMRQNNFYSTSTFQKNFISWCCGYDFTAAVFSILPHNQSWLLLKNQNYWNKLFRTSAGYFLFKTPEYKIIIIISTNWRTWEANPSSISKH